METNKEPTSITDTLGIAWGYSTGERVSADSDLSSGIVRQEDPSWLDRNIHRIVMGVVGAAALFTGARMCNDFRNGDSPAGADGTVLQEDTSASSSQ